MVSRKEILLLIIVFSIGVIIIISFLSFYLINNQTKPQINNFQDCVNAGHPVIESYPRMCKTPDGYVFTEKIDDKLIEILNKITPTPKIKSPLFNNQSKKEIIINNQEEFNEYFSSKEKIDFNKNSLIVFLGGQRNTGGYSVEIQRIIKTQKNLELIIKERVPGENCAVTQAISYPFDAVVIPKTTINKISSKIEIEVYNC